MNAHPVRALAALGQSLWYDQLSRSLVADGTLRRLISQDGLRGMTSNPAIFEKSIIGGAEYGEPLAALASRGRNALEIYEELAVGDVGSAADEFRPLYEETKALDGYVSIEVNPKLAHDTAGTIAEARRLWAWLNRPNIMIKVPATDAGLPAIETLLSEGINVNVTLIFSIAVHRKVMNAYTAAIRNRHAAGLPVASLSSVASFFVSRIDSAVDALLEKSASQSPDAARLLALRGRAAICNARLAYQAWKEHFATHDVRSLGARTQRPLWASTGTKNPAYSDVLYVDELIGAETVNTVPPATFDAFRDHGTAALTVEKDIEDSRRHFDELAAAGISIDEVTDKLTRDGVQAFIDSFDKLLAVVEDRRKASMRASARSDT